MDRFIETINGSKEKREEQDDCRQYHERLMHPLFVQSIHIPPNERARMPREQLTAHAPLFLAISCRKADNRHYPRYPHR